MHDRRAAPRPSRRLPSTARSWFFPGPGVAAASADVGTFATIGIFVVSGLLLQKGESLAAVRSTAAVAYGLAVILALSPLLAFGLLRLPLQPREMALGLAVFACMPTTLSANVTLTTAAAGNTAVALLLTVASNTLAVRGGGAGRGWAARVPAGACLQLRQQSQPRPRCTCGNQGVPARRALSLLRPPSTGLHHPRHAVARAGQRRGRRGVL